MAAELASARQGMSKLTGQVVQAQADVESCQNLAETMQSRLSRVGARAADDNGVLREKLREAQEQKAQILAEAKEVKQQLASELESCRVDAHAWTVQAKEAEAEAETNAEIAEEMQLRLARVAFRSAEANHDLSTKLAQAKERGDAIRADADKAKTMLTSELESARNSMRARAAEAARAQAERARSQRLAEEMKARLSRAGARAADTNDEPEARRGDLSAESDGTREGMRMLFEQVVEAQKEAERSQELARQTQEKLVRMGARASDANRELKAKLAAATALADKVHSDSYSSDEEREDVDQSLHSLLALARSAERKAKARELNARKVHEQDMDTVKELQNDLQALEAELEAERQRNAAKSQDHVVEQLRAELEAQRARDESHLVPELRAELEAARSWAEYNENELLNELKAELQHERARANNAVRESEAVRAAEKIIKKQAAKKERAAAKKERAAAEKERAAAEKEQAVAEKEQAVAEKERATEKEWATAEKERAAAENERSIAENERAVAANERAVAENERSVAEKARAVAEEERAILKNERSVLERERATEKALHDRAVMDARRRRPARGADMDRVKVSLPYPLRNRDGDPVAHISA